MLKGSGSGDSIAARYGEYSEGDGQQWQLAADGGLSFGEGAPRIHLTAETGHQDITNRSGAYTGNFPGVGEATFKIGDPEVDATSVAANISLQVAEDTRFYATLMGSNRDIDSPAFYRSKNHSGQGALLAQVYPDKQIPTNSTFGLIPYSLQSPFGFNGRYYYARAGYSW